VPEHHPRVSFGLPVRNGGEPIRRCLDSLLAQDFEDIEILVSDNASDDGTQDVLREYSGRDSRIRLFMNETDVGQIENFNCLVRRARGEFFRWIGAEDWLEPQYATRCLAVFEEDPGAIVVTSFFRIHYDGGESRYHEYYGELLESPRPARRLQRLIWSFNAGDATYEPLYSLIRRDVLERTALIRMMVKADRILAVELALAGRFRQLNECLAHRWKPMAESVHSAKYLHRYRPERSNELQSGPWRQFRVILSVILASQLSKIEKLRCMPLALLFFVGESWLHFRGRLRKLRRSIGLTRHNLGIDKNAR